MLLAIPKLRHSLSQQSRTRAINWRDEKTKETELSKKQKATQSKSQEMDDFFLDERLERSELEVERLRRGERLVWMKQRGLDRTLRAGSISVCRG